jgi:DMSO/TMAO reductase YedYZ heme-binding membrane subunit
MGTGWGYITRSSGIVATVLLVLSLGGGFAFSGRATGSRRPPKWWLDLHNQLGGLAFAFTLYHVYAAYRDRLSGIGIVQVLVPMTASGWAWGITWGVLATYVFAAVVLTSWPRKRLSKRAWLTVHLLSIPATVMVAAHAWMIGSDRHGRWFQALLALLAGVVVYPAVLRVAHALGRRRPVAVASCSASSTT